MPQPIGRFRLVIKDENLAAWMVINNTFICKSPKKCPDWNPKIDYWVGVLFQLGTYSRFSDGNPIPPFSTIRLLKDGKEVGSLKNEDFAKGEPMWVNIVTRAPLSKNHKPPMKQDDLEALRVSKKPGTLDYYFKPYPGAITFWSERFGLKMERHTEPSLRHQVVFESPEEDSFEVEAYKGNKRIELPLFDEMQVLYGLIGLPEGGHSSPPQDP